MSLHELKAQALKAREFVHCVDECEFTLRTPTRRELFAAAHGLGLRDLDSTAERQLLQHALVAQYTVGWTGVRLRDIVQGSADTSPVAFSADAMGLLQDADPELADALGTELLLRVRLRNDALEDAAKNSQRTSSEPMAATACASSANSG